MKSADSLLKATETILAALCIAGLLAMFVLGVATVFFRFVVESSLAFPEELIRYLFIWITALGSAVAYRRNAHAAIGLFVDKLPVFLKRWVLMTATVTSGAFFALLVTYGYQLTRRVVPQISPALEISMAWVYAAVPVGGLFLLLFALELLAKQWLAEDSELSAESS